MPSSSTPTTSAPWCAGPVVPVNVFYGNPSRCLDIAGNEQETCDILLAENVASFNYRYNETVEEGMVYDAFATSLRAIDVIKACHCLEYQSCEHDGWATSTAKVIVAAIEGAASRALPGYDDAPWEIKAKEGVVLSADS